MRCPRTHHRRDPESPLRAPPPASLRDQGGLGARTATGTHAVGARSWCSLHRRWCRRVRTPRWDLCKSTTPRCNRTLPAAPAIRPAAVAGAAGHRVEENDRERRRSDDVQGLSSGRRQLHLRHDHPRLEVTVGAIVDRLRSSFQSYLLRGCPGSRRRPYDPSRRVVIPTGWSRANTCCAAIPETPRDNRAGPRRNTLTRGRATELWARVVPALLTISQLL